MLLLLNIIIVIGVKIVIRAPFATAFGICSGNLGRVLVLITPITVLKPPFEPDRAGAGQGQGW
jgi:hypothetical protein